MTLANAVELWEYQHSGTNFMNGFTIHKDVNKATLLDYLLYDYGELRTVETNSDAFHDAVDNFFKVHKWNIDKLADSMNLQYDTLGNVDWKQVQDFDRGQDFDSATDRDVGTDRKEGILKDEEGTSDETDKHYVSAYNDDDRDTPKSRDTIHKSYEETQSIDDSETINTAEDIFKTEQTKENIDLVITKKGHDGNISYQSLIEEERKQAQFNLYKWIGNYFSTELLICLW